MKRFLTVTAIAALAGAAHAQDAGSVTPPAAEAAPSDWRAVEQDNLLYITVASAPEGGDAMEALLAEPETSLVVVELFPDFAPNHVQRMKTLAQEGFYKGREFQRVIDGFVAQAGGLPGQPAGGDSGKPDLKAEFTARLGPEVTMTEAQDSHMVNPSVPPMGRSRAGFYHGAPVGYQPAAQAQLSADGKRDAWLLHCPGTASMARPQNEDGANFQFFLMRGAAPFLDAQYSAWGRVVHGQDVVETITTGEPPDNPDTIQSMAVGSDLPESQQLDIEVLRTDSEFFKTWLQARKDASGGQIDDICNIDIPTRVNEDS